MKNGGGKNDTDSRHDYFFSSSHAEITSTSHWGRIVSVKVLTGSIFFIDTATKHTNSNKYGIYEQQRHLDGRHIQY
jgi:hypothetical protein